MYYTKGKTRIHYQEAGEGKPVLMIHGLGCDLRLMKGCMEPIFHQYDGKYKRIYLDLPGMGQSNAELEEISSDGILQILVSFAEDVIGESFLLAGESYGGYLARGVLAKLPQWVDGMLLLCPVVIARHADRNVPSKSLQVIDRDFFEQLDHDIPKDFLEYAVVADQHIYSRYLEEIDAGVKILDKSFIYQLSKRYPFSFDVDQLLRDIRFQKPVLLISGRQDNSVGYQDLWKLTEDYPRATYAVLDMTGHNLQLEQPELFTCLTRDWLRRLETTLMGRRTAK